MEKLLPLNYARPINLQEDRQAFARLEAFRELRMIYCFGVGLLWLFLIGFINSFPHTSNSLDPTKALLTLWIEVTGGTALAWLVLGLRRIWRSRLARRSVVIWLAVVANAFAALFVLS